MDEFNLEPVDQVALGILTSMLASQAELCPNQDYEALLDSAYASAQAFIGRVHKRAEAAIRARNAAAGAPPAPGRVHN